MLNNFLAANAGFVFFCIVDILLILALVAVLIYMIVKPIMQSKNASKNTLEQDHAVDENGSVVKDDAPTEATSVTDEDGNVGYVIQTDKETTNEEIVMPSKNPVEHFSDQITNLNEEYQSEFKSNVVVRPANGKKPYIVKDEVVSYTKSDSPRQNASFEDSTTFLNTIQEQKTGVVSKNSNAKTAKVSNTKANNNTSAKTSTGAKRGRKPSSKSTSKTETSTDKPKRKYTKKTTPAE